MADAVTTGAWTAVSTPLVNEQGLGTDVLRWGVPTQQQQSGYRFAGRQAAVPTDGTDFTLGTFTHENFPVKLPITKSGANEFDVDLKVTMAFEGGDLERDFSFKLHHTETPNTRRPLDRASADRVGLSTMQSSETVVIDGTEYAVEITGFMQDGNVVTEFVSFERAANSADIVAKLTAIKKPEPPAPDPPAPPAPDPPAAEPPAPPDPPFPPPPPHDPIPHPDFIPPPPPPVPPVPPKPPVPCECLCLCVGNEHSVSRGTEQIFVGVGEMLNATFEIVGALACRMADSTGTAMSRPTYTRPTYTGSEPPPRPATSSATPGKPATSSQDDCYCAPPLTVAVHCGLQTVTNILGLFANGVRDMAPVYAVGRPCHCTDQPPAAAAPPTAQAAPSPAPEPAPPTP
jgi:hypothetical protein